MRDSYLVTYDICDPKRLRLVFRTMRNWGDHLQYSVFECQLTRTDLIELKTELKQIIHETDDQVLLINLGPSDGRGERVIEALGQAYVNLNAPCLIV